MGGGEREEMEEGSGPWAFTFFFSASPPNSPTIHSKSCTPTSFRYDHEREAFSKGSLLLCEHFLKCSERLFFFSLKALS